MESVVQAKTGWCTPTLIYVSLISLATLLTILLKFKRPKLSASWGSIICGVACAALITWLFTLSCKADYMVCAWIFAVLCALSLVCHIISALIALNAPDGVTGHMYHPAVEQIYQTSSEQNKMEQPLHKKF